MRRFQKLDEKYNDIRFCMTSHICVKFHLNCKGSIYAIYAFKTFFLLLCSCTRDEHCKKLYMIATAQHKFSWYFPQIIISCKASCYYYQMPIITWPRLNLLIIAKKNSPVNCQNRPFTYICCEIRPLLCLLPLAQPIERKLTKKYFLSIAEANGALPEEAWSGNALQIYSFAYLQ